MKTKNNKTKYLQGDQKSSKERGEPVMVWETDQEFEKHKKS